MPFGKKTDVAPPAEDAKEAMLPAELMARVRQIQLRTARMVDDVLSGAYRSSYRGSGIEFEEVRPYQVGDDVRTIDWNRTASSHDGAFVKTYVEERELTLHFLVDCGPTMDFGSAESSKREVAATLAALLSYVAVRQEDRVGLTLYGAARDVHLPPRKGMGHVSRVVREVLAARPGSAAGSGGPSRSGGSDLGELLLHEQRTLGRRSLVLLVSDFLELAECNEARREELQLSLARLARRHDVVAVRIVDPLEERLPNAGRLMLEEVRGGRRVEVDSGSAEVRRAWAAAADARLERIGETLRTARVARVDVDTSGDVAEPIIAFFKSRRRWGRGR